jgi:hypothetical protein
MTRISELAIHFLVNAAWQIAAVVIVASLCARLLRNVAGRYRHAVWSASLVLSVTLPLWSLVYSPGPVPPQIQEQRSAPVKTTNAVSSTPTPSPAPEVLSYEQASGLRLDRLLQARRQLVKMPASLALGLALAYAGFFAYRFSILWRALRAKSQTRAG